MTCLFVATIQDHPGNMEWKKSFVKNIQVILQKEFETEEIVTRYNDIDIKQINDNRTKSVDLGKA